MFRIIIGLIFITLSASAVHSQVKFNLGEEYKALDYYRDEINNGQVYSCKFKGKRKIRIAGSFTNAKDSLTWYRRKIKLFRSGQKREIVWLGYGHDLILARIKLYDDRVHSAEIMVTNKFGNRIYKKIAPEYPEYFTQKNDFIKN
jgi:hypothetical protein